jgi:hypothetical protein
MRNPATPQAKIVCELPSATALTVSTSRARKHPHPGQTTAKYVAAKPPLRPMK